MFFKLSLTIYLHVNLILLEAFTTSGVTTNSEMTATASFASFSDASTFTSTGILSTHSSVAASAFTSTDTASGVCF